MNYSDIDNLSLSVAKFELIPLLRFGKLPEWTECLLKKKSFSLTFFKIL